MTDRHDSAYLEQAVELLALAARDGERRTGETLMREYGVLRPEFYERHVKFVTRAVRDLRPLIGPDRIASQPGAGYWLDPEAARSPRWVLPLLLQYLSFTRAEAYHPALESLVYTHGCRALYYLVCFRIGRDASRPVRFAYAKSREERPRARRVLVTDILIRSNRILAAGFDLDKGAVRHYILNRVTGDVLVEDEPVTPPRARSVVHEAYAGSLGVFMGGAPVQTAIRFAPDLAADIRREFFHASQSFTDEGDAVVLRMTVNNPFEALSLVSRFLGKAELLEPAEWRRLYTNRLRAALELHAESTRE